MSFKASMTTAGICDSVEEGVRLAKEHDCPGVWIYTSPRHRYMHWVCEILTSEISTLKVLHKETFDSGKR